jgi:hypothetical protein
MDTSWSVTPEISCVAGTRLRARGSGEASRAGDGREAAFRPGAGRAPDPVRWSGLSAGARLRRGLAGFRCAAVTHRGMTVTERDAGSGFSFSATARKRSSAPSGGRTGAGPSEGGHYAVGDPEPTA